jgi:ADP-heptose:LPS heptosyltransferase
MAEQQGAPRSLVIQLARFGDLLQSGRLLRSLAATGETHLCLDSSLAELAALIYPGLVVHALRAHGTGQGEEHLAANLEALEELGRTPFTGVYNLNHSGLNRALASMFDPAIVRGYAMRDGQIARSRWLDLAFRWTRRRRSAPLNLVDVWAGLLPHPLPPDRCHPPAVGRGRGLGVVLAGREARRSLPPEVLGPCVHALFERLGGARVWIFGDERQRPLARRLMRHLPRRVLDQARDLTGLTNWADLYDAVTGLDCLLTPDTGTMHLAAAAGVPVQAVFLSSAWAWETGPYGTGHVVWQAACPCAPCLEAAACDRNLRCLEPFRSRNFLNALAGRRVSGADEDLWRMQGYPDALGLCWSLPAGTADPQAGERQGQRALLHEFRGLELPGFGENGEGLSEPARTLYHEADWMLPPAVRE